MTLRLKKNDQVIVLTGKDKNKKGKILKVFPKKNRAMVEGVNFVKKSQRTTQKIKGGIVEKEAPVNISNLQLICPKCNKGTRIKRKVFENMFTRVCENCSEMIDKG